MCNAEPVVCKRLLSNAYAALAEEKYNLNAYPVVINLLPPKRKMTIGNRLELKLFDLEARRTFRIINLWEVDVDSVFKQNLVALLPFVPLLKGGDSTHVVAKSVAFLRADEKLAELETLLAFFAAFVLDTHIIKEIMRWDMAVLRESPWYTQILEDGLELGLEQGRSLGSDEGSANMLLLVLRHRFGPMQPALEERIRRLHTQESSQLVNVALDAPSIEAFTRFLDSIIPTDGSSQDNGQATK